ncbi:MAG: YfhO family protein [Tidjanibacter sp.]|nr:YfhO family protein [Tidjanibacter sp.]
MKAKQLIIKALPYIGALLLFFVLSAAYFGPQLEGKVLSMGDITQYEGMCRDIKQMQQTTGEDPQWAGNAFSGMPAYMINIKYPSMIIKVASEAVANAIGRPIVLLLLAMVGFWAMLLLWGVGPLVAIVPAIAYGFSTYSILIIGAGHITKMFAFAYAPLIIGGVVYTLRSKRKVVGALMTALFAALQIGANHPQITYYFGLVIVALWVNELVKAIKEKTLPNLAKSTALLAIAAVLAVGANFSSLYYTAQHQPDTTRGGSELVAQSAEDGSKGLDLAYATAWSYGRTESFNLLVPNLMGGGSAGGFSRDGAVADSLKPYGARSLATQLPAYWGDQPSTAGPTYLGASVLFLAVLGLFLLRGKDKWWLVVVSVFALLLAWGSNLMWFTELMFKILPAYDKFRAVSTALVVVQWSVPLLGALVLWRISQGTYGRKELLAGVAKSGAIVGGVALVFALLGGAMFDFTGGYDTQLGLPADVVAAMQAERADMLRADALRSLVFVALGAGVVALLAIEKVKGGVALVALGALVAADMIGVDSRYLGWDDFMAPRNTQIQPSQANLDIMADGELGFRVANLAVSTFNDATTSYFHRSVGGYHGAKLSRYQDLIEHQLQRGNPEVYDMLNTKYFIVADEESGGAPVAVLNDAANGPAWFVEDVVYAATPAEEMALLDNTSTKNTAIVESRFEPYLQGKTLGSGAIELVKYQPNKLAYEYHSTQGGLCVFSEIYYDKGWTAWLDGREIDYIRANYLLRTAYLPAGSHIVEFRFRAPDFDKVEALTLLCSLVIVGGLALCAAVWVVRKRKQLKNEK